MNALKRFKDYLNGIPFLKNLYLLAKTDLNMIYHDDDLTAEYYNEIKRLGDDELEHQIGRLVNFKKIISAIKSQTLSGDVLEFGTYRGFSLLWIAYLMERAGLFRKIVGIDSFAGLPNSEGNFIKGTFSDTSLRKCLNNIKYSRLYQLTKNNIKIEKYRYSQQEAIISRLKATTNGRFCFVHIDCDLSSSVMEIFKILQDGNLLSDTCYLLFDDYGCTASYRETVNRLLGDLGKEWQILEHSDTKLTKNYLLKRKQHA